MLVPKAATVEAPTYPPVVLQTILDLPHFAMVPWQLGCDQGSVLPLVVRRDDEGHQTHAGEIRQSRLVAVPVRTPPGDADIRTSNNASRRDAAVDCMPASDEFPDDPVGSAAPQLVERFCQLSGPVAWQTGF
jgi:hypothetical protein